MTFQASVDHIVASGVKEELTYGDDSYKYVNYNDSSCIVYDIKTNEPKFIDYYSYINMHPVLRMDGDSYYIDNVLLGAGYRIITNGQKTTITHPDGKIERYFNSVLHCDDGPAVIFQHNVCAFYGHDDYIIEEHVHINRNREYAAEKYDKPRAAAYYNHGKIHNANGPAIVDESGCSYWINDKLHRIGGPAVINKYHGIRYYIDGLLSNISGPAVINPRCETDVIYLVDGVRHRSDGPAYVWNKKTKYYINGEEMPEEEYLQQLNANKLIV